MDILGYGTSVTLKYTIQTVIRKGNSLPSLPRNALFDLEARFHCSGSPDSALCAQRIPAFLPRARTFLGGVIVIAEFVPGVEAAVFAEGSSLPT